MACGKLDYWSFWGTSFRKTKPLREICDLYNVLVHPAHTDPPSQPFAFGVWQQGGLVPDITSNEGLLHALGRGLGGRTECGRRGRRVWPLRAVCKTLQRKVPWITDLLLNAIKGAQPGENRGRPDTLYLESWKVLRRQCRKRRHKMSTWGKRRENSPPCVAVLVYKFVLHRNKYLTESRTVGTGILSVVSGNNQGRVFGHRRF